MYEANSHGTASRGRIRFLCFRTKAAMKRGFYRDDTISSSGISLWDEKGNNICIQKIANFKITENMDETTIIYIHFAVVSVDIFEIIFS